MLIILHLMPVSTPLKTERLKHYFAEIILIDFMREILTSINIVRGRTRLNK